MSLEGSASIGKVQELQGKLKFDGDAVIIGALTFEPHRVRCVQRKLTRENFRLGGIFVQRNVRSNLWHLGDWSLLGDDVLGEEASQYCDSAHFTEAMLRRARWVCEKIDSTRRVSKLSFEHHAAVARLDASDQDKWLKRALDREWSVADLRRQMREKLHVDRYKAQEFPAGKYRVIYADPPWEYRDGTPPDTGEFGRAARHYPTMPINQIRELSVADLAATNCALFLWVPAPLLPEGLNTLAAWGDFAYKTQYVWDKERGNIGHYSSVRHENLLLAVRGTMVPESEVAAKYDSVVTLRRSETHSQKPEAFREMIDTLYPPIEGGGDRVELFARGAVPNHWTTWGNESVTRTEAPEGIGEDNPVEAGEEVARRRGKLRRAG